MIHDGGPQQRITRDISEKSIYHRNYHNNQKHLAIDSVDSNHYRE